MTWTNQTSKHWVKPATGKAWSSKHCAKRHHTNKSMNEQADGDRLQHIVNQTSNVKLTNVTVYSRVWSGSPHLCCSQLPHSEVDAGVVLVVHSVVVGACWHLPYGDHIRLWLPGIAWNAWEPRWAVHRGVVTGPMLEHCRLPGVYTMWAGLYSNKLVNTQALCTKQTLNNQQKQPNNTY